MSVLTADEIARRRFDGSLEIEPYDQDDLGPNSYDVHLASTLHVYLGVELDTRRQNPTQPIEIPAHGYVIRPGELYLGSTVEVVGSSEFVVCLEGRSSLARLGVSVHQTAGFGDLGFVSRWTLEITAIKPVRIYPGMRIAQAVFHTTEGRIMKLYEGKYGKNPGAGVEASKSFEDREVNS